MGKLFVTLFADSQPSTGTSNQPGTRTRSSACKLNHSTRQLSGFETICIATAAPLAFTSLIYMDNFSDIYKNCTATAPALSKICTRTAKSAPYLSCHLDSLSAKVPGQVAGWLRQVTQPPYIAGPLAASPNLS